MRPVLSIVLLMLVFYHTGRVWIAVSCFEQLYSSASPSRHGDEWMVVKVPMSLPYTSAWEEPQGKKGLMRINGQFYNITHQRYANDTLYTELKTNTTAREHFFSLVQQIQQWQNQEADTTPAGKHPLSRMIQFLNQWAGSYLSADSCWTGQPRVATLLSNTHVCAWSVALPVCFYPVSTPPPEHV